MNERSASGRQLFLRWVRATWAGWVLGVPCIIALALIGEAVGIGGAQVIVGAGMGTGLGLLQGRALGGVLPRSAPWFWSCVGGLAAPFLATDIATAAGWSSRYSLQAAVAAGGLIVGSAQALILRRRFHHVLWWIADRTVGWALAGGTSAIAESVSRSQQLRGVWGALAYLAIVAGGGLILGVVTGLALVGMRRRDVPSVARDDETI